MKITDLKPCPFCGGEAERRVNATFGDMSMVSCRSCGAQAYDRKWDMRSAGTNGGRALPYDRDTLGRFVREAWVRWAETQPAPKPSWLVPYDQLSEADKEADRQIGEALSRWTLIGDAALTAALAVQTQQGVEVKKLEWKETSDDTGRYATANTRVGGYDVFELHMTVRSEERVIFGWTGHWKNGDQKAESFEAAKAAAQSDYEARIRSALVDVPAVESEPAAWKQIEGYEGLYEVSSGGDVRSTSTGKILAKNLAGSGYVKADLWKDGERHQTTVHRLVADAFIPRTGDEINHINGVKTDNRRENLEWCSRSENVIHTYYELGKGIHPIEAYNPDTNVKRLYRSVCEAARDGFGSAQIYRALRKPHRRVKGFHFSTYAHPPRSLSNEGEVAGALQELLEHVDRNTCAHEDTHRGGLIWTICDACGMKWADDEGGFKPYADPPAVARARAALSTRKGSAGDGAATGTNGGDHG